MALMMFKGYTGIFRRLAEEHKEVDLLMQRVEKSSDADVKRDLVTKIRRELLSHAKAEEQEFYSVLREHSETRELAAHSKEEHDEIEFMFCQLDELHGAAWNSVFTKLMHSVQHHVNEEETRLFPRAKAVLSSQQIQDIEKRYAEAKASFQADLD